MIEKSEKPLVSSEMIERDNLSAIDTCRLAQLHLADIDSRYFSLEADLGDCGGDEFKELHPDRFYDFGIAEANMMGSAVGISMRGKIPFVNTFASFALMRACEQVRIDVCYNNANVKIAGMFSGIASSASGPTHHSIEDIAIARSLPNMTVIAPSDALSAYYATIEAAHHDGPVFIRLGVDVTPKVYNRITDFQIGKGNVLTAGKDLTLIASGLSSVANSVLAAKLLKQDGISVKVIDMHTIKPIDKELIIESAKETRAVITVEEHSVIGGLGSAVAEVLAEEYPVPLKIIGLPDEYCHDIGPYEKLLRYYGLDSESIAIKCKNFLKGR